MKSLLLAGLATAVLALAPLHAAETATGQKAAIGDWGVDTKGLSKTVSFRRAGIPDADAAEAEERRRILSDPHSAGEFRVNGIVRNVDAWYKAFDVKPGDKLYLPPEQRVKIW